MNDIFGGQESGAISASVGILHKILSFFYSLAHQFGIWFERGFHAILPKVALPVDIMDAIGVLIVITLFYLLMQIFKKAAGIVLIVGWILILIRILLVAFKAG
jgi:hypothetical protein